MQLNNKGGGLINGRYVSQTLENPSLINSLGEKCRHGEAKQVILQHLMPVDTHFLSRDAAAAKAEERWVATELCTPAPPVSQQISLPLPRDALKDRLALVTTGLQLVSSNVMLSDQF